jgi:hypothetical protein
MARPSEPQNRNARSTNTQPPRSPAYGISHSRMTDRLTLTRAFECTGLQSEAAERIDRLRPLPARPSPRPAEGDPGKANTAGAPDTSHLAAAAQAILDGQTALRSRAKAETMALVTGNPGDVG